MYEELYAQNKGLLITLAQRYAQYCVLDRAASVEDLVQTGFLSLVQAAQTYDPEGGKTWAGWAAWYIRRDMKRLLGLEKGHFTHAHTGADSLDRQVLINGEGSTLGALLPGGNQQEPDAELLRNELCREVREAVARLDDDLRRVTQLCRLESRSAREAAEAMGVSEQQVRQLTARADKALAQDWRLRRLADLDECTRFHAHKGVAAFNRDWTSVTEAAALWRVEQKEKCGLNHEKRCIKPQ